MTKEQTTRDQWRDAEGGEAFRQPPKTENEGTRLLIRTHGEAGLILLIGGEVGFGMEVVTSAPNPDEHHPMDILTPGLVLAPAFPDRADGPVAIGSL